MLELYAGAKLIITNLLHCAMPCLALGTPVVLLKNDLDNNFRFSGLTDLVRWGSAKTPPPYINWDDPEPNNDAYLKYANGMDERCREVISEISLI